MKRSLSLLLAICLIAACLPLGAAAQAESFTDLDAKKWYYPAVSYCLEKGLMSGVGTGKFEPNAVVSRAQITQVLYNREGKPSFSAANKFSDVTPGRWYADGVIWCNANGIVNGESATAFAPSKPVTREQLCTMLYNYYTKFLGYKAVQASEEEMAVFADYNKVSSWAKDAIRWAVKAKVMKGKTSSALAPAGKAVRAELAQFLLNFDTVLESGGQPQPTVEPTVTPVPTKEPTPTPAPTAEPTATPVPTPFPSDVFPLSMKKPLPIVAGPKQTLAIHSDGTVRAAGLNEMGGLNVQGWTDIVDLASTRNQTLGVKSDGTVVGAGHYYETSWKQFLDPLRNVVDIAECPDAINAFIAALHSDGTVTFINKFGESKKLDWTNIVQICVGKGYLVGLRSDGTVAAYGMDYFKKGCMDVNDWTGITFIEAGMYNTFGVKADGTVVMVGEKAAGKGNVGGWTDIVAVASGASYTVGLRKDGTLVGTGLNGFGQISVEDWRDIVAVSVGNNSTHTVALRKDGTVLATGYNGDGQCEVDGWTGIKTN